MFNQIGRTFLTCLLVASSACAMDDDPAVDELDTGGGKADQISGNDDPSGVLGNAERRLSRLISKADVGQSFGVDDDKVPYPDTYWPMVDNGIAVEWAEQAGGSCAATNECDAPQASPLAKYMQLTRPSKVKDAVAWEIKNHGKDVPNVASWFGHCPGWTASAQLFAPITKPAFLKRGFFGRIVRCTEGDVGCIKFEIGDLNALQAEVYNNARSTFIGARCDTEPSKIERDEDGRIVRTGAGCQGLNAGSMLIVAANLLKLDKAPFGIDAQNQFNTDQIWNQPAYRYTVHRFESLTEAEAANLVATGKKTGDRTDYEWNSSARGFALVDFAMHWVSETSGPNTELVSGLETTEQTRMVAVIELDRSADDPGATIIGGEYLDDASVGANRLKNHPFVWQAISVGADDGFGHNPFVKGKTVNAMIKLALAK